MVTNALPLPGAGLCIHRIRYHIPFVVSLYG